MPAINYNAYLARLIEESKKNKQDVADAAGITRQQLYQILKKDDIRVKTLNGALEYIGVNIVDFFAKASKYDSPLVQAALKSDEVWEARLADKERIIRLLEGQLADCQAKEMGN